MARPEDTPVLQMSEQALEAIHDAGGVADESAHLHVHPEMNHLCVSLVGTAQAEGLHGFVMFCDHHA